MIAFIVCALAGVLQAYLLSVVLKGALNGSMKQAGLALLGKFLCYGITFALLWFLFMDRVLYCAAGFIVGVIISVIINSQRFTGQIKPLMSKCPSPVTLAQVLSGGDQIFRDCHHGCQS